MWGPVSTTAADAATTAAGRALVGARAGARGVLEAEQAWGLGDAWAAAALGGGEAHGSSTTAANAAANAPRAKASSIADDGGTSSSTPNAAAATRATVGRGLRVSRGQGGSGSGRVWPMDPPELTAAITSCTSLKGEALQGCVCGGGRGPCPEGCSLRLGRSPHAACSHGTSLRACAALGGCSVGRASGAAMHLAGLGLFCMRARTHARHVHVPLQALLKSWACRQATRGYHNR